MEARLSIITLGVADLSKSENFYLNIFGWEKSPQSNDNILFMHLNGMYLSCYKRDKLAEDATVSEVGTGFKAFSLAYNTRSEKEVNELFLSFEEKGVNIIKKPEKAFWGGYSGYIADPDDNLWEIAYNPFVVIDAAGNIK
ncbi:MAG: VOC family protein [Bacteroidota bacterium]